MKYKCKLHRNIKDFKFGTMRLELHSNGSFVLYGILKKKKSLSKYVEVYRVDK